MNFGKLFHLCVEQISHLQNMGNKNMWLFWDLSEKLYKVISTYQVLFEMLCTC